MEAMPVKNVACHCAVAGIRVSHTVDPSSIPV